MFRKPKRKGPSATIRKKDENDESENLTGAQESTTELLQEARKRVKTQQIGTNVTSASWPEKKSSSEDVMQSYQARDSERRDVVTSVASQHPIAKDEGATGTIMSDNLSLKPPEDGIFRDTTRNKFHAGPIRAATNIRTTVQFDYQPDICKDYKETGFCGFGDTCIYLHDRGDTLSGWQIEQQWEQQQKKLKEHQEKEMSNFANGSDLAANDNEKTAALQDGIPFACHVCRDFFKNPVVTNCMHYFCERCIMDHVRTQSEGCPVCGKDTGSVFNQPTKLIAKKRKLLGSTQASDENSWQEYANLFWKVS